MPILSNPQIIRHLPALAKIDSSGNSSSAVVLVFLILLVVLLLAALVLLIVENGRLAKTPGGDLTAWIEKFTVGKSPAPQPAGPPKHMYSAQTATRKAPTTEFYGQPQTHPVSRYDFPSSRQNSKYEFPVSTSSSRPAVLPDTGHQQTPLPVPSHAPAVSPSNYAPAWQPGSAPPQMYRPGPAVAQQPPAAARANPQPNPGRAPSPPAAPGHYTAPQPPAAVRMNPPATAAPMQKPAAPQGRQPDAAIICPACQCRNEPDSIFCAMCGKPLSVQRSLYPA